MTTETTTKPAGASGSRRSRNPKNLDHIVEPLRRFAVKLDDLKLDPKNARLHSEKNIAAIVASLKAFGQDEAVIVQKRSGVVRVGNGRVIAARELVKSGDDRWSMIAAIVVDEDDLSAAARAVAHNRTAELSGWDRDVLAATLKALQDDGGTAAATGFTDDEVAALVDRVEGGGPTEPATKTITFKVSKEDHAALLAHLKTFDDDRNKALSSWLAASSGKGSRS